MARFTKNDTARGDPCELIVTGEVDLCAADALVDAALGCLMTGAPGLRIDLSSVTFLDAGGTGALVRINNAARATGKRLVLTNPAPPVIRLLRVTDLLSVFDIDAVCAAPADLER